MNNTYEIPQRSRKLAYSDILAVLDEADASIKLDAIWLWLLPRNRVSKELVKLRLTELWGRGEVVRLPGGGYTLPSKKIASFTVWALDYLRQHPRETFDAYQLRVAYRADSSAGAPTVETVRTLLRRHRTHVMELSTKRSLNAAFGWQPGASRIDIFS